ncbi:GW domain-containing glycosaminoglycan-binding protein [Ectobacillus polymachus]|uniref:GW domain-containing glycosaminoglycan-binding protein n=1 Tax=Ectobacillus polymachus TaxID=1508806 RepID=UPI003A883061
MDRNKYLKLNGQTVAILGITVTLFLSAPVPSKALENTATPVKVAETTSSKVTDNVSSKPADNTSSNVTDTPSPSNKKEENITPPSKTVSNALTTNQTADNIPPITKVQENQIIEITSGNGIWSVPYGLSGANYIGSTNDYATKEVQLIQKMTLNNVLWYQFSVNGKVIGWLDSRVLSHLTNMQEINEDAVMGATSTNGIWSVPYGVNGAYYIDTADRYAYRDMKLVEKANFGSITWYKFSVDGKVIGWIDAKALDKGEVIPSNLTVMIGNTYNNGVWSVPYGIVGASYLGNTNDYAYQTVQVIKSVKRGNTTWYQVSINGKVIGWIDGKNAVTDAENVPVENNIVMIGGSAGPSDGVWSVPYGDYSAKWIASVSDYSYKQVEVLQSIKKQGVTWSKIKVDGKVLGWIDARTLSNMIINNEDRVALIGDTNGHAVWTLPYGEKNAQYIAPASSFINNPIHIIESLRLGNVNWYHFKADGYGEGWIDARAISVATDIRTVDGIYHVSSSQDHGVWTRPYGMQNASWAGSASDFTNMNLTIRMAINYNGVTWYEFIDQKGRMNWIDSRAMSNGSVYPHLNVPIIEQRDPYFPSRNLISGCEITAVTMMLQYAGANVDKVQLAYEMPYHSYDPNQGYVGNPFGSGWTIYPPALMNLVTKYTGSAINLTGQDVKDQLSKNHPVVAWMTMHGFTVHAITLTGFDDNNIYYNDPWTGEKDARMSQYDFYYNWSTQNKRAISY